MKLSQYIRKLEILLVEHGDLPVDRCGISAERQEAQSPVIRFRKILSKRESRPSFYSETVDTKEQKGEKVVQV